MFSSDLNHLTKKSFSRNELQELHDKIVETMCVHEGLFGESECLTVHHQLLHLPKYIEQMGPIDSFWTYTGERAMFNIKNAVHRGGRNFIKTLLQRFCNWEQQRIRTAYNFSEIKNNENGFFNKDFFNQLYDKVSVKLNDGIIEHNDLAFSLFGPIKYHKHLANSLSISSFEMENLLTTLVNEICKQFDDVNIALHTSSFYRLYFAFKEFHSKNYKMNFSSFLKFLCEFSEEREVFIIKDRNVTNYSRDLFNQGKIFESDLETAKIVEDPFHCFYSKGIIYGKEFHGRGLKHRENSDGQIRDGRYGMQKKHRQFDPCNSLNVFNPNIFNGNLFASSMVRYKLGKECHITKFHKKRVCFGNVNFFFRMNCPNDPILNNIPMCNLVPRKVSEDKYGNHFISLEDHYYEKNLFFVPVTNIYGSVFLHSPPINENNVMIQYHLLNEENMLNCKIYLIPLHPNFLHFQYEFENNKYYNGFGNNFINSENKSININDELYEDDGDNDTTAV